MKLANVDITKQEHLLALVSAGWTHIVVRREWDESDGSPIFIPLSRARSIEGARRNRIKDQGMGVEIFPLQALIYTFGDEA